MLELLKHWENHVPKYNRQRHNRSLEVIDGQEPPPGLVEAQFVNTPNPKRGEVLADVQLDGAVQDDGASISSNK